MIGSGLSNLDFSVFKNNLARKLFENFNVPFRAGFFNILNRAHLVRRNSKAGQRDFHEDDLTNRCPGSSADTFQEYSFA